jgi:hypothetical protein
VLRLWQAGSTAVRIFGYVRRKHGGGWEPDRRCPGSDTGRQNVERFRGRLFQPALIERRAYQPGCGGSARTGCRKTSMRGASIQGRRKLAKANRPRHPLCGASARTGGYIQWEAHAEMITVVAT